LLALALVCACGESHEPAPASPTCEPASEASERAVTLTEDAMKVSEIKVGKSERRSIGGGGSLSGEVVFDPSGTAHVAPLGPGRFVSVTVAIGDVVAQDQLLGSVRSSETADLEGQLAQARARLSGAEAALRRAQQVVREGVGPERGVSEAQATAATLRAEVVGLKKRLEVFGGAEASGELALRAPIAGTIVAMHAVVGESASNDEPAFTITDPSKVFVRGFVPELELASVAVDAPVIVRLHAYEGLSVAGHIDYLAPSLDPSTRALPIRVKLDQLDARIKSGLFVVIELMRAGGKPVVVPSDGVATLAGQDVVFVPGAAPRSFTPQPVRLGRRAGGWVEVLNGLDEGAAVVTHGGFILKSALSAGAIPEED